MLSERGIYFFIVYKIWKLNLAFYVSFLRRESDITKERIGKILASGANVIFTTGGIDDLCLKYFVEAGAMGVRRCKKMDLKRIAKATGGHLIVTLANMEGDESFDPSMLGQAEEVSAALPMLLHFFD